MEDAPEKNVTYFGRIDFRSKDRLFGIRRTDRRQHMYVIGKTGTGKSAMLHNLIIQDIANGEGVCVVDPHGELVESILKKIPKERLADVVYFNPADSDYPIGFNVLELPDPKYKHLVASGLMGIFTKIWAGTWSARMEYILNNAVLALLDTPGSTLLGISRILVDKQYRQQVLSNVKDPIVRSFWLNEFEEWRDQFRNEAIAPIQNKVGQFLSTAMIRNVVGQSQSTIDVFKIMNEGKIFLVNVSKGRIGEDNSALLGAMLITKIQLAAMERVRIPEDERVDFYLYVDEFQNFATDSFAGILSEARKYRLDLILAHQYVGQLVTDVSTKVRDAVFGNVGTMVVFRVGAADAEFLEQEFTPEILPEDIVNLPNYTVYLKLMVDGVTSRPFSARTLPPFKVESSEATEEMVIEQARKRYAKPRQAVEEEISRWAGGIMGTEGAPFGSAGATTDEGGKFETVCSSCGKTTTVPFKPEAGRPVYCQDCLKKIKAGELQPVRVPRAPSAREEATHMADLSKLGIEFGGGGTPMPSPASPRRVEAGSPRPPARMGMEGKEAPKPPITSPTSPARPQLPASPRSPRFAGEAGVERGERSPTPVEGPVRRASILRDASPASEPVSESEEHKLRLSELTPTESKESKKPAWDDGEPDIKGLQDALRDALGKLKE
ncbi:MAG: type IV secretion system DNA-binding domain-containing protein [Candidatus Jorgensenbacteria bacterium]|nr:type IV secretion system DNA-binding domain-containing protein [Candidatus Jorgensenbacteria bacterium]